MRHLLTATISLCLMGTTVACRTTQSHAPIVYRMRVESGDTLAALARKYDTTPAAIVQRNHLVSGSPLVVGSTLRVEPGPAGVVAGAPLIAVPHEKFVQETSSDELDPEIDGDSEDAGEMIGHHKRHHGLLFGDGSTVRSTKLDWPLYGSMTSPYGPRHGHFHRGIDIRAKKGTTVLAAAPGKVEFAGRKHGFGRVVIVRHRDCRTIYAHLDKILVDRGEAVNHATEVGLSGNSGHSTGPHLHFEIRSLDGDSVDPMAMISRDRLLSKNP